MPGIAFFDVDHTITRRSSGGRFVSLALRQGILPWRLVVILPYYSFTYRLGLFRLRSYKKGFPYLRGIKRALMEEIARESFRQKLREDVYPGALSLIRERREAGQQVALATSSVDILVEPLARYLGIEEVLATSLEFDDGVCTGHIVGVPMFRREKRQRVLEFIARKGEKPEDCSFYSDSIFDLPLLESVGRPVAVNPDLRLRRVCRKRGWPIIRLS